MICSEEELDDRQSPIKVTRCNNCKKPTMRAWLCGRCKPGHKARKMRYVMTEGKRYRALEHVMNHGPCGPAAVAKALGFDAKQVQEDLMYLQSLGTVVSTDGLVMTVIRLRPGVFSVTGEQVKAG